MPIKGGKPPESSLPAVRGLFPSSEGAMGSHPRLALRPNIKHGAETMPTPIETRINPWHRFLNFDLGLRAMGIRYKRRKLGCSPPAFTYSCKGGATEEYSHYRCLQATCKATSAGSQSELRPQSMIPIPRVVEHGQINKTCRGPAPKRNRFAPGRSPTAKTLPIGSEYHPLS